MCINLRLQELYLNLIFWWRCIWKFQDVRLWFITIIKLCWYSWVLVWMELLRWRRWDLKRLVVEVTDYISLMLDSTLVVVIFKFLTLLKRSLLVHITLLRHLWLHYFQILIICLSWSLISICSSWLWNNLLSCWIRNSLICDLRYHNIYKRGLIILLNFSICILNDFCNFIALLKSIFQL